MDKTENQQQMETRSRQTMAEQTHGRSLISKAKRGFRGHPAASVVFYGPDDQRASKVAVGIIGEGPRLTRMERWCSEDDVRKDPSVLSAILQLIEAEGVRTVMMPEQIIGCPHEEGIDYPQGQNCPQCPFWADRDRRSGVSFL